MKIKINLILLLSTFLLSIGGTCAAAPRDEIETSPKDLRTYTLSILFREINDAVSKEFGITDWGFIPKKVCEINGTRLTLEGDLFKDKKQKTINSVDLLFFSLSEWIGLCKAGENLESFSLALWFHGINESMHCLIRWKLIGFSIKSANP